MQAVILAGGKGSRLRPYTSVLPKPLMPVGDKPILEILLTQLKNAGVSKVTVAVGYLAELFSAVFGDGKKFGLKIDYSIESEPLGTAGPLALILDRLEENFYVMNGDVLTTLDYKKLYQCHVDGGQSATIAVCRREIKSDFGIVEFDSSSRLSAYREKPVHAMDVSMGINVFAREKIRPFLKAGEYLDLPDLLLRLNGSGHAVRCFREDCYWLDIGRPADYETALDIYESRSAEFLRSYK